MRIFQTRKTADKSEQTREKEGIELKTLKVYEPKPEPQHYYGHKEISERDDKINSTLSKFPIISYSLSYLDPKEILTQVSITCKLFRDCTFENIVWTGFLQNALGNNITFAVSPEKRAPRFVLIGKNGFNYFAEQMKINIASTIQELSENKQNFEFKGTKPNLILTLSDPYIQRLLQVNVINLNYLYNLKDEDRTDLRRYSLSRRNSFRDPLSNLEKNWGNKALRKQLIAEIKDIKKLKQTPIATFHRY